MEWPVVQHNCRSPVISRISWSLLKRDSKTANFNLEKLHRSQWLGSWRIFADVLPILVRKLVAYSQPCLNATSIGSSFTPMNNFEREIYWTLTFDDTCVDSCEHGSRDDLSVWNNHHQKVGKGVAHCDEELNPWQCIITMYVHIKS